MRVIRRILSLVLIASIVAPHVLSAVQTTTTDPQEIRWRLLGQKAGTTVTVTLRDGTRALGRLGQVTENHFELQIGPEGNDPTDQDETFTQFRFEDVADLSVHVDLRYPPDGEEKAIDSGSTGDIRAKIMSIDIGSRVLVVVKNGETVTGRLDAVTEEGFSLGPDNPNAVKLTKTLSFDDVESIRARPDDSDGGVPKWVWAVVILGGVLGTLAIYCATGRCAN